jgi:Fe2+ transport system protein FeoA
MSPVLTDQGSARSGVIAAEPGGTAAGRPVAPGAEAMQEARLTLAEVPPGQSAFVLRVGGERVLRRRLVDLGLTAGAEVRVQRIAPLGDPLEILVKGTHLSLRLSEAATIEVRAHQEREL